MSLEAFWSFIGGMLTGSALTASIISIAGGF